MLRSARLCAAVALLVLPVAVAVSLGEAPGAIDQTRLATEDAPEHGAVRRQRVPLVRNEAASGELVLPASPVASLAQGDHQEAPTEAPDEVREALSEVGIMDSPDVHAEQPACVTGTAELVGLSELPWVKTASISTSTSGARDETGKLEKLRFLRSPSTERSDFWCSSVGGSETASANVQGPVAFDWINWAFKEPKVVTEIVTECWDETSCPTHFQLLYRTRQTWTRHPFLFKRAPHDIGRQTIEVAPAVVASEVRLESNVSKDGLCMHVDFNGCRFLDTAVIRGRAGTDGRPGARGTKGPEGAPGVPGAQGKQGRAGLQGARGAAGKPGKPSTAGDPIDCELGSWSEWLTCPATCGIGNTRMRERGFDTYAQNNGKVCEGALAQIQACNDFPCPKPQAQVQPGETPPGETSPEAAAPGEVPPSAEPPQHPEGDPQAAGGSLLQTAQTATKLSKKMLWGAGACGVVLLIFGCSSLASAADDTAVVAPPAGPSESDRPAGMHHF